MISIGKTKRAESLVDLLLECHGRIQKFAGIAERLAAAEGASAEEIREAASAVRRYFAEALPLHVADEDESLTPRLRGRSEAVDRALMKMRREHEEHAPKLARLIALMEALVADPSTHAAHASELRVLSATLAAEFAEHLDTEERILFPAVAALDPEVQAAIRAEIAARRT